MKYDFDKINDRRSTNSVKWDVKENELPMWVADMDFQTVPAVVKALEKRAGTGIYGYSTVSDEWKQSIQYWWNKRHGFSIKKDWLIFCTGVVPAITCAVKRLTNIGDNVLVQTPVYNIFFNSIENHGRHVIENKLKFDGNQYQIDFNDLENKLAHPQTTMMILCNPHNPIGKIWDNKDLEKIGQLCFKYHVVVISDEIHCDVTEPGYKFTPFASISDTCAKNSVTCISASKAFNLAGLQGAAVIIPRESLRQKMERGLNSDEIAEPNVFSTVAMIAAFTEGEDWLDDLRGYLQKNKNIATEFIEMEIPNIKVVHSHATYLLWINCGKITGNSTELCSFIRKETGLYLSDGAQYRGDGCQFIRMNIACPTKRLEEGLSLLKKGVQSYKNIKVDNTN